MVVRYQADMLPHVKRVDIDSIQLKNALSRNMPRMEEVSSCPVELLPNEEWQNDVIFKFSELRLVCVYTYACMNAITELTSLVTNIASTVLHLQLHCICVFIVHHLEHVQ